MFVPGRKPPRRRPTAGKPPVNLEGIAGYLDVDGTMTPYTVADAVVSVLREGGFEKDAAARGGVDKTTLRGWMATGSRARRQVLQGERRAHDLTEHEAQCVRLLVRIEEAEAEARVSLSATAARVAQGGIKVTETTVKREGRKVTQTVTERETLPDGRLALQLLAQRWPNEWGRHRVEVSGPDGGAVQVDVAGIRETVAARLATIRERAEAAAPERMEALAAQAQGNGHTNGHNGNGHNGEDS